MRVIHHLLGVLAGTLLIVGEATATMVLPEGTSITAEPTSLLGFDASLNDYVSGGSSALTDQDIEFLTDDFALGIDFQSNGLLRLWDNLGTGTDAFNYTLRFSFPDLALPLHGIGVQDTSNLTGGNLFISLIGPDTFELALRDVQFSPGFTYADLNVSVPEPGTLILLVLGLLAAVAFHRRSASARGPADPEFSR